MQYVELPLNNLPIKIMFFQDGCVAFEKTRGFKTLIDNREQGIQAIIDIDGIYIGANTEIEYGVIYNYKEMGELLSWLQSHKLILPIIQGI